MKFSAILVAVAGVPAVLADFHVNTIQNIAVTGPSSQQRWTSYVACPSNYWNCKCLANGDRAGPVSGKTSDSFFSVQNLCGMRKLNFYRKGNNFDMYEDSGNGQVIGTCYPSPTDQKQCVLATGNAQIVGGYVCYSYVCGK
ncbi:hypothetical protein NQ176_g1031 [Zarea fungicola]|uniref:Uncharacterized protein n=1 Tax=Zarea fungicola TaxID=93591 RepID=A0ACC1NX20_9HYPO|nr:hypothetical protein NQ176_g1031 [Lecanicillium fungicola]